MFLNIGRTGRAGRRGEAITLFTEADMPRIRSIANVVKLSGCEVPDWMLAIKPVSVYLVFGCLCALLYYPSYANFFICV